MNDYIKRDKAIEAIAEHLMGEAVIEYPDASDNIEDWKEIGEAILESIPPAEVIPKGSNEASLAYAEGWKNGEEAERSRHKITMSDYIERKSIRNMYSCLNPEDKVRVAQVLTDIDAIPSAKPTWTDTLAELHERFDALEKELRRASAEMSAIIREYVDRPKGDWVSEGRIYPPTNGYHGAVCSICGTESEYLTNFCGECGADMSKDEPQTEREDE